MSISNNKVSHIARLARIKISTEEADFYAHQLNGILELVAQISHFDTTDIEPMSHPQDIPLRMRKDVVTATNQRDAYQALAPKTQQGLYLVPQVIE